MLMFYIMSVKRDYLFGVVNEKELIKPDC